MRCFIAGVDLDVEVVTPDQAVRAEIQRLLGAVRLDGDPLGGERTLSVGRTERMVRTRSSWRLAVM
jgi:hypothetical protein